MGTMPQPLMSVRLLDMREASARLERCLADTKDEKRNSIFFRLLKAKFQIDAAIHEEEIIIQENANKEAH